MAYISKEDVSMIRKALKEQFKGFKFSVRMDNHYAIRVAILSGTTDFGKTDYEGGTINHHHTDRYQDQELLERILHVINTAGTRKNYDRSDSMTDYFDVGYYVSLTLGKWDKAFVLTK